MTPGNTRRTARLPQVRVAPAAKPPRGRAQPGPITWDHPPPGAEAEGETLLNSCLPVRQLLSRVGDKWSVLIVMALRERSLRFNEIKRALGTISQRMLTLTLRGMERDGLVSRTVTPTNPPRVDYALTALGNSLRGPIEGLGRWATDHHETIIAAQAAFDGRSP